MRLTTSLFVGAKSWVCVVQVSKLLATPLSRFLPPTDSITLVSYWGKTCCYAHHTLLLGTPNEAQQSTEPPPRFSGAVAGEAKDVFTRGVLHNLSLFFVFVLLSFFFLVLFASFYQKFQKKLVYLGFLSLIKNTKKLVPALVAVAVGLLHFCQNELWWEHQVVWLH